MEHGLLPAAGVSARVIEALAASSAVEPDGSPRPGSARRRPPRMAMSHPPARPSRTPELLDAVALEAMDMDAALAEAAGHDEIDALFLDG